MGFPYMLIECPRFFKPHTGFQCGPANDCGWQLYNITSPSWKKSPAFCGVFYFQVNKIA